MIVPKVLTKSKYIPPKIKAVPFSELKLGRPINSGITATVYNLKGFKSLVAKTNNFDPTTLKWDINPYTHSILATHWSVGNTVIMERVAGKPLHEKNWTTSMPANVFKFKKQLKKLLKIPDEAYEDYMKKVIELRKNGYNIDKINPNNILYDKKSQKFGIVDVSKEQIEPKLLISDFSPFVDDCRLLKIYEKANVFNRFRIIKLVKEFYEKIVEIATKNGYGLKLEPYDPYNFQDTSVYMYHNLKDLLDRLAKSCYK